MSQPSTLSVDRLHNRYLLPRDHPRPETVRRQLDAVARRYLEGALAQAVQQSLANEDDKSIWLIRRLNIDVALDAGASPMALANRWGLCVAETLQYELQHPSAGNVRYFPDRAAYVGSFVLDLVAGQAWEQWYYEPFAGLRSLLPHQAVREAIVREGEAASRVLVWLRQEGVLEQVLTMLTGRDAERLYAACRQPASSPPTRPLFDALRQVWPHAQLQAENGWNSGKNRLRLWLAWYVQNEIQPPLSLDQTIIHLLTLKAILEQVPDPALFLKSLLETSPGQAAVLARSAGITSGPEMVPTLHKIMAGDAVWLHRLAGTIAPEQFPAAAGPTEETISLSSPAAGFFLLLPTLLETGFYDLLAAGALPGEPATWLYWLARKAMGRPWRKMTRADPALLWLLQLAEPPSVPVVKPAALAAFQQQLLQLLLAQGRLDGRYLALEKVEHAHYPKPLLLIREMGHDYWLQAGPAQAERSMLALVRSALEQPEPILWRGKKPVPAAVASYGARAKSAAAALEHFALAPELPPDLDLALTLPAQILLRTFARRLSGFAWSSPSHLSTNFLTGPGTVEATPEHVSVYIRRPPLHVVLRMAGLHERHIDIPWLNNRPLTVYLT